MIKVTIKTWIKIAIIFLVLMVVSGVLIINEQTAERIESQKYKVGETFAYKVEVEATLVPINAVEIYLSFDPEYLEVVDISIEGSLVQIFIDKEVDNKNGKVRLMGGVPNPGTKLENKHVAKLFFKGKKVGKTEVKILPFSSVLANDGKGSNVIKIEDSILRYNIVR